jgi:hypothetical protein
MERMESSPMLCKQGVAGSIPATSTKRFSDCKALTRFIFSPISLFWSLGLHSALTYSSPEEFGKRTETRAAGTSAAAVMTILGG